MIMMRTKSEGRMVFLGRMIAVLLMSTLLVSLVSACAFQVTEKPLAQPERIIVYFKGVASEYTEGDREYSTAFDMLEGTHLDGVLETAVDSEAELKKCDCIEFVYSVPQHIESGSITREYDRLLFCFTGSNAGEAVLGVDGRYVSGTYKMESVAWPF